MGEGKNEDHERNAKPPALGAHHNYIIKTDNADIYSTRSIEYMMFEAR